VNDGTARRLAKIKECILKESIARNVGKRSRFLEEAKMQRKPQILYPFVAPLCPISKV
jgi:hypothetical protein